VPCRVVTRPAIGPCHCALRSCYRTNDWCRAWPERKVESRDCDAGAAGE
jgi:hypothetical protein